MAWPLAARADEAVYELAVAKGDTLIGIGQRLLADPASWPEIARANALRNPNRIAVGTTLRVPLRLLRSDSVRASVLSVAGNVRDADGAALQPGQGVAEGGAVATGGDGQATIRLVDGTVLRLRPDSRLVVRESRQLRDVGATRSGARLERGRVEIKAAPAHAGQPGFSIETPQGVLGVRGTEFRVAAAQTTHGEVLEGTVAIAGGQGAAVPVHAGYGSVVDAGGHVAPPVRLLDAPGVAGLPVLQDRVLVRFSPQPVAGATAYRGEVARDARFDTVLAEVTSPTPELRFAGLADGRYLLRVRAIDANGLEGQNADLAFTLKARPEAPLPATPASRAVSFGSRVEFGWAGNPDAAHYRLQLAAGADYGQPLRDVADVRGTTLAVDGLAPGVYHWRMASVRGDGDQGPWGVDRSFELRPLPPTPAPPAVGERGVDFSWEGLPGQTFEFEVASDAAFGHKTFETKLAKPGLTLPLPPPGRYFVRLRARDADGYLGPYTRPQLFEIPNCLRDVAGSCVRAGDGTLNLAQ
ncbi:MAG: FecR domain-containing protein [Burkholderiales bacterium]|nr:FecR domain-containing protein [Burkholderiales bacterium]